jgi:hypothetical protein
MELIGLDVGFSADRASSGVARLSAAGELRLDHTTSEWADRRRVLGNAPVDVAAIDAPFTTAAPDEPRNCERIFSFGSFQKRCKPGASHVAGTGQQLRAAGNETAEQLRELALEQDLKQPFPRVGASNVVEAFPNAFLGVCLDTATYDEKPDVGRGDKFDWLYDCWVREGLFAKVISSLGISEASALEEACLSNQHHDERGALVCLLTAASVWSGRYTAVGDPAGGYFFMPPWSDWAGWARRALNRERKRLNGLRVWIDGTAHRNGEKLPEVG